MLRVAVIEEAAVYRAATDASLALHDVEGIADAHRSRSGGECQSKPWCAYYAL